MLASWIRKQTKQEYTMSSVCLNDLESLNWLYTVSYIIEDGSFGHCTHLTHAKSFALLCPK